MKQIIVYVVTGVVVLGASAYFLFPNNKCGTEIGCRTTTRKRQPHDRLGE